jgi:hypothetical protein
LQKRVLYIHVIGSWLTKHLEQALPETYQGEISFGMIPLLRSTIEAQVG